MTVIVEKTKRVKNTCASGRGGQKLPTFNFTKLSETKRRKKRYSRRRGQKHPSFNFTILDKRHKKMHSRRRGQKHPSFNFTILDCCTR